MHKTLLRVPVAGLSLGLLLSGCTTVPEPIESDARDAMVVEEKAEMFKEQEPVYGPVSLQEAMARALKYNLDHRLKLMEEAMSYRNLELSDFEMLPKLTAAAGYDGRNNFNASSSIDAVTFTESLTPSFSQDRDRTSGDLTFSWNILDFGVSYYQSHQSANRVLVAKERRRKVVQNLMQQVRYAYWRALGAQALEGKIQPLIEMANQALDDAVKIEKQRLQAPLESLKYQKALLEIIRQLEKMAGELAKAKPQLASLMNLQPGAQFQLAEPEHMTVPKLGIDLESMESYALKHRPELMEARYQERISVLDTKIALARMMPGLEISFGYHQDSNSLLLNETWREGSLRVTWNLLNMLSGPKSIEAAEAQVKVTHTSLLALNIAILSQVHIAMRDFEQALKQYGHAVRLNNVDQRILSQVQKGVASRSTNRLTEIRSAISAVTSDLQRYQLFATLQSAYGQIEATMGVDPLPDEVASHSIADLAAAIEAISQTKPYLAQ